MPGPDAPPRFDDPRLAQTGGGDLDLERTPLAQVASGTDPDVLPAGDDGSPILDMVLAELEQEVELPDVLIEHRLRPGFAVRYSLEFDEKAITRWTKAATPKTGKKAGANSTRFAGILLANLCLGIEKDGVPVLDADGEPLTFRSPALQARYKVGRAGECAERFYGSDPYLVATGEAVLREAGVGEEVDAVDPTDGSAD